MLSVGRLFSVLILLTVAGAAAAAERFLTSAEIELRREEVSRRLEMLAAEAAALVQARQHILDELGSAEEELRDRPALTAKASALHAHQSAIEREMAALREEHARLAAIPTRSATGPLQQGDPQGLGTFDLSGASDSGTGARAFNPAMSIIPDANYYADNRRGRGFPRSRQTDGFAVPGDDERAPTDPARGFNLREVEAAFMGSIDPYFDVWTTVVIQHDRVQAEEAYVQTRRFIPGLQVRFGRYLSGIGYINRQHPHQWDFFDQALPYEAVLAGGLADTGVQVTWLPALPVYLLLGFEALQGDNPRLANQVADEFPDLFGERAGPRLLAGFLRVSPDVGYSNALQVGVSYAHSRGHQEVVIDGDAPRDGFEGDAWLAGADLVWRHDSGRAYGHGNLTLQAEYLYRRTDVEQTVANGRVVAARPGRQSAQDGLYVQAVYGIAARWTVAGRADVLGLRNRLETLAGISELGSSSRVTANATFNPTEFSRIRFQYSHGRYRREGTIEPVHQFAVQFQMSLGAHGAHRF